MAVQAAFSADVVAGLSPLTVNFTDESTGAPTNWLWDFGDGQGSESQHPTHIYEEDGAYTVTLKAYIKTGSTEIAPSISNTLLKAANSSSEAAAWTAFLSQDWQTGTAVIEFEFSDFSPSSKTYFAQKSLQQFDFTSFPTGLAILKYRALFFEDNTDGRRFKIKIGGDNIVPDVFVYSSGNIGNTIFPNVIAGDISNKLGTLFSYNISAADNFTVRFGLGVGSPGAREFRLPGGIPLPVRADVNTYSDLDTEIKENFIVVGPPIADFSGVPLSGSSPLSVTFSNLSLGPITSYSWRKRKAGTNDAFVEFSTAQNPSSQEFDKTNP